MKNTIRLITAACCLMATACTHHAEPVEIHRFEQLLFSTPTAQLKQVLEEQKATYNTPLLNVASDDPQYIAMVADFVADPIVSNIHRITDSIYHDLDWLEQELGDALARAHEICPEVEYDRIYTLITADFQDYPSRVFCYGKDMAISIDRYAVGEMADMQHFGMPSYLVNLCQRQYIVPDCMAAAVASHVAMPAHQPTFLDQAIADGKVLYLMELSLPSAHDTLLLRYTSGQLKWMQDNVSNVWGWLIGNNILYSNDHTQLRNLLDDAPKTNAFGEGSAPRTGAYIGWQIVRKYMKKSGATMSDLLADTDSRRILNQSGWRP